MKLIIDIDDKVYGLLKYFEKGLGLDDKDDNDDVKTALMRAVLNGTSLDNATNGDAIKTMFGDDKVSEFMGYARIMARVGNWFNDGVVAEFDKDWWNAPYRKDGE